MEFPDQNCFGCSKMIREKDFKMFAQKVWHKNCFKCAKCHDTIDDPQTMTFIQNNIFCTAHIESGEIGTNAVCPTCDKKFEPFDKNMVNANRLAYHNPCFKCGSCAKALGDEKEKWVCHEGKIYCVACHSKEVVNKCLKCKKFVPADKQLTSQAGIWCAKCYICSNCRRPMKQPDKILEIQAAALVYCDRCQAAYQKAKYNFDMNKPGVA